MSRGWDEVRKQWSLLRGDPAARSRRLAAEWRRGANDLSPEELPGFLAELDERLSRDVPFALSTDRWLYHASSGRLSYVRPRLHPGDVVGLRAAAALGILVSEISSPRSPVVPLLEETPWLRTQLADHLAYLRTGHAVPGRSAGMLERLGSTHRARQVVASGVDLLTAEPYFLSSPMADGVLTSKPLDPEDEVELRLPAKNTYVWFERPLEVPDEIQAAEFPGLPAGGRVHITGVLFLGDSDLRLMEHFAYTVVAETDNGLRHSIFPARALSTSVLRPQLVCLAAITKWGDWLAPAEDDGLTVDADRKVRRSPEWRRAEESGRFAGVHRIDVDLTAKRSPQRKAPTGRHVDPHTRRGHYHRFHSRQGIVRHYLPPMHINSHLGPVRPRTVWSIQITDEVRERLNAGRPRATTPTPLRAQPPAVRPATPPRPPRRGVRTPGS